MSSRSRVRGEFQLEKDGGGAFVSANLVYNALLKDLSGFQLREAYAYWGNPHWDIRAGRQIISWGVADGLRVTDLISPMDYTEFLAQDYDDIRIPVGALRARFIQDSWSLEAVAVPVAEFFKLPTDPANPWSVGMLPPEVRPDPVLKNSEFGARFCCFLGGVDFSLMALRTWTKMPELQVDHIGYHRLTVIGGDVHLLHVDGHVGGDDVDDGLQDTLLVDALDVDAGPETVAVVLPLRLQQLGAVAHF